MADEDIAIIRLFVEGRVQGVGYRAFLVREATRLNLSGWARNRLDGSVEAVARGPRVAIDDLVARARRGPTMARVEALRAEPADAAALAENGDDTCFVVAPTV